MIELPFFPFCAMMNAGTGLRACLYCWMLIGLVDRQMVNMQYKGEVHDERSRQTYMPHCGGPG